MHRERWSLRDVRLAAMASLIGMFPASAAEETDQVLDRIGVRGGIVVVLGDPKCELAGKLARASDLTVFVQLSQNEDVQNARAAMDAAGLYGTRVFVDGGSLTRLHLADNLADAVIVTAEAKGVPETEALRVLRPQGKALFGSREIVKPFPQGTDDWSHPYHGPDNNPQSKDQVARVPYLTQFLAEPRYAPLPQVTVASAGRVYKGFGHVAFKPREEAYLNTLVAFNGYNGTILWKRDLVPGIMVDRNTMIATPTTLYLGDDKSCKLIDAATGEVRDEITPPKDVADGTFWKWMALDGGVLYAVTGEQEREDRTMRWDYKGHGWPWNAVAQGYNQPKHEWGFGRALLAIDPGTKKILWSHREEEPIDCRAVCMAGGRIYIFRFGSFLACINAKTGAVIWRKTPADAPDLFASLGKYMNRQGWETNWRTSVYLKCSDRALYFAGPPINKLLAVSTEDGHILWENKYNNYQLVLRDDGLYGISGPWGHDRSARFDPLTGAELARIHIGRRACTRSTGSIDSIFLRAMGGSLRIDPASNQLLYISPMRPSCQDGVTVANGLLYWWPMGCDCQLTLLGVACLGPAGDFNFSAQAKEAERLEVVAAGTPLVAPLPESPGDWPTFRANNECTATTAAAVPETAGEVWQYKPNACTASMPTAPVVAGGLAFLGGSDGSVRALDMDTGNVQWTAYTGGAVRIPPAIWQGRALVASGDGWVYCHEARTGRLLWRFRAAPAERAIPVYGSMLSTWPVGSGVLVHEGTAYFAAGMVNYDGTYVYALDAATGRIKWQNNTSGHLYPAARTGVSVQGHMLLHAGSLYLAGGNAVSPAVYDISDGKCLNDPGQLRQCESVAPRGWELFLMGDKVVAAGKPYYASPRYPVIDPTVKEKTLHASNGLRDIAWINNRRIVCYEPIDRQALAKCVTTADNSGKHMISTWGKFNVPGKPLWEYVAEESAAVALGKNAVVVAKPSEVVAVGLKDGKPLWTRPLPVSPVPWGLAVDGEGRIVVVLEDGRVCCFGRAAGRL